MNGVYSTAIVLWAFMSQVMRDGKEAACQSAVARIVAYLTKRERRAPVADTGNYCRARAKLPEGALKELSNIVAGDGSPQAVDDTSDLQPDTHYYRNGCIASQ